VRSCSELHQAIEQAQRVLQETARRVVTRRVDQQAGERQIVRFPVVAELVINAQMVVLRPLPCGSQVAFPKTVPAVIGSKRMGVIFQLADLFKLFSAFQLFGLAVCVPLREFGADQRRISVRNHWYSCHT
jgi:hypothetical protein